MPSYTTAALAAVLLHTASAQSPTPNPPADSQIPAAILDNWGSNPGTLTVTTFESVVTQLEGCPYHGHVASLVLVGDSSGGTPAPLTAAVVAVSGGLPTDVLEVVGGRVFVVGSRVCVARR
jgi:hypothetical protein